MDNDEFKGTTKEAIRNLREHCSEIKDDIKEFSNKNETEHKEIFAAITEINLSSIKLGWKAWSIIGAAFMSSIGGIIVVLLTSS